MGTSVSSIHPSLRWVLRALPSVRRPPLPPSFLPSLPHSVLPSYLPFLPLLPSLPPSLLPIVLSFFSCKLVALLALPFIRAWPSGVALPTYPSLLPSLPPSLPPSGAAYKDLRPIVEFMTFNFSLQAIDQVGREGGREGGSLPIGWENGGKGGRVERVEGNMDPVNPWIPHTHFSLPPSLPPSLPSR